MVKKAAEFARKVHEGKLRKGSMVPYIVHPFEAAVIVSGMTDDPEVISAALLHDVIEDAGISYEELKMQVPGSRLGAGRKRGQIQDLEGAEKRHH